MSHFTLQFPDRATAQAAAQLLGFWNEPTGDRPEGSLRTDGQAVNADGTVRRLVKPSTPRWPASWVGVTRCRI